MTNRPGLSPCIALSAVVATAALPSCQSSKSPPSADVGASASSSVTEAKTDEKAAAKETEKLEKEKLKAEKTAADAAEDASKETKKAAERAEKLQAKEARKAAKLKEKEEKIANKEATKKSEDSAEQADAPMKRGFFSWFKKKPKDGEDDTEKVPSIPDGGAAEAFTAECSRLAATGGVVTGRDGYAFSPGELSRALASGSTITAITTIKDFANQLKEIGTELVLVPVPTRPHVYPDKLSKELKSMKPKTRVDKNIQMAVASLRAAGVPTVDLAEAFMAARGEGKPEPMLRTAAASWSPAGAVIAAQQIAAAVRSTSAGGKLGSATGIAVENAPLEFKGALAGSTAAETLPTRTVGQVEGSRIKSISFRESGGPVLLMGDESILAWRQAGNPAGSPQTFASLADQLTQELEVIPDVRISPGDPRNAPRTRIMKERTTGRSTLSSTKALVWVFPAADLFSTSWRKIPLQVQLQLRAPEIELNLQ